MTRILDITPTTDSYASAEAFHQDYKEAGQQFFEHAVYIGQDDDGHRFAATPLTGWGDVFDVRIHAGPDATIEDLATLASGAVQHRLHGLDNGSWDPELVERVDAALNWKSREERAELEEGATWAKGIAARLKSKTGPDMDLER